MIELFESISALQKQKGLGNPARQDIVMVLEVPHVHPNPLPLTPNTYPLTPKPHLNPKP